MGNDPPEPPESWSPWSSWKASSAALTWRYRTERGLCSSYGEHPAGESCRWDGGVAPTEEPAGEYFRDPSEAFEKERHLNSLPEHLPNKPLIEAILEVRRGQDGQPDPAYPLIVGRLYERLRSEYPAIEDLPIVAVPAEIWVHQVRHRFRKTKDGWPLVQVGPGVLTVNETDGYRWRDFSERAKALLPLLHETHPKPETIQITSLTPSRPCCSRAAPAWST